MPASRLSLGQMQNFVSTLSFDQGAHTGSKVGVFLHCHLPTSASYRVMRAGARYIGLGAALAAI